VLTDGRVCIPYQTGAGTLLCALLAEKARHENAPADAVYADAMYADAARHGAKPGKNGTEAESGGTDIVGYKIIAGLGNPGREYEGTRHNMGFDVIDLLLDRYGFPAMTRDGKAMTAKGLIDGQRVLLMKPLTYMNLSGEAIQEAVQFYKADPEQDVIVICDDIDQPVGQLRIRPKGSAGGHNGLKNIIRCLGTEDFTRVRVGVGAKPSPDYDLADYVLGRPAGEDRDLLAEAKERAADAVGMILTQGVPEAMNQFNGKVRRQ